MTHGTYSGYQTHIKAGVTPCPPCRDANNEYHRVYVATHPENAAQQNRQNKALGRAKTRLGHLYPDALRRLYYEEMER